MLDADIQVRGIVCLCGTVIDFYVFILMKYILIVNHLPQMNLNYAIYFNMWKQKYFNKGDNPINWWKLEIFIWLSSYNLKEAGLAAFMILERQSSTF